jgi:hypothetical protein
MPSPTEDERLRTEAEIAVDTTFAELYLEGVDLCERDVAVPRFIKRLESKGFVIVAKT